MREMIKDEEENDVACALHALRRARRSYRRLNRIPLGAARLVVFQRQDRRRPNVDHRRYQQTDACQPKQWTQLSQELGIAIDMIGVLKDLQISHEVTDD